MGISMQTAVSFDNQKLGYAQPMAQKNSNIVINGDVIINNNGAAQNADYGVQPNVTNNIFIVAQQDQPIQAPQATLDQQIAQLLGGTQQPQQLFGQPLSQLFGVPQQIQIMPQQAVAQPQIAKQPQIMGGLDELLANLRNLVAMKKLAQALGELKAALSPEKKDAPKDAAKKDWSEKTDAEREKDAPKLCKKLDKLGFKKDLIDKLQMVLESGKLEDLTKAQLTKFDSIMKKITKLADKNIRLTESQIKEYSEMIEKLVKMVEVDKKDDADKDKKPADVK